MKRLFAVALIVVSAAACKGGATQTSRGSITRQYEPQTQVDTHGDLDRAIGQR